MLLVLLRGDIPADGWVGCWMESKEVVKAAQHAERNPPKPEKGGFLQWQWMSFSSSSVTIAQSTGGARGPGLKR